MHVSNTVFAMLKLFLPYALLLYSKCFQGGGIRHVSLVAASGAWAATSGVKSSDRHDLLRTYTQPGVTQAFPLASPSALALKVWSP